MRIMAFQRLAVLAEMLVSIVGLAVANTAFAEEPAFTFGFLTDTHQPGERVQKALELFKSKGVPLIVHGGDLVQSAHDVGLYETYKTTFDSVFDGGTAPTQLFAVGNHDVMLPAESALTKVQAAEEMMTTLGAANAHTDVKTFGGYTFLVMPYNVGEEGFLSWSEYEEAVQSACAANPGKPVFLLEHEPPQDTIYNSHNWGRPENRAILNRYPQVVELSGHVHGSLRNDQFLWQGEFTVINAGCLQVWNGLLKGQPVSVSKDSYAVLTVEVYADRLVARRWDILDGSEICGDAPWTIPLPFVAETAPYNRANLVAAETVPSFPSGAAVTAASAGGNVAVSFPELAGNVMTYWITVSTADAAGNPLETVAETEIFSDFWVEPSARTGKASATVAVDLDPQLRYVVAVQPVGQYGKRGTAIAGAVAFEEETPFYFTDYIDSNGGNYIDTKVIGRSGTKAEIDLEFLKEPFLPKERPDLGDSCDWAILNARKDGGDTRFFLFHTANKQPAIGYGTFKYGSGTLAKCRYRLTSTLEAGNQTLDVNGVRVYTAKDGATIDTGRNLYLFANNYGDKPQNYLYARCYGLKIWQTDASGEYRLVRDFVPCFAWTTNAADGSTTGAGALYDRVSKRIFYGKTSSADQNSARWSYSGTYDTKVVPGKPDGFVDFIQTHGKSVINTGVPARTGVRVKADVRWMNSGDEDTLIGAVNSSGNFYFIHHVMNEGKERPWLAYADLKVYPTDASGVRRELPAGVVCHYDVDFSDPANLTCQLNGETIYTGSSEKTVDLGVNLTLFACNHWGKPGYVCDVRFYGMKIWLDGRLVRDFRPCLKDGKAGVYDAVRDEMLFPANDIAPSNDAVPTDLDGSRLTFVDYVENDWNSYFDVEVTGRSGTKMETDMAFCNISGDIGYLDARGDKDTNTRIMLFHCYNQSAHVGYKTFVNPTPAVPLEANVKYHVESVLEDGRQELVIDGKTAYSGHETGKVTAGKNLYLFGNNYLTSVQNKSLCRCYGLKLWQKDEDDPNSEYELVRDFRPCLVFFEGTSRGTVAGLYDAVSGRVFKRQGTGAISVPKGPRTVAGEPDRFVEYIQSDGLQALDTGVVAKDSVRVEGDFSYWKEVASEQSFLAANAGNRFYMVHMANKAIWAAYGPDGQSGKVGYVPGPAADGRLYFPRGEKIHFDVTYAPNDCRMDLNGTRIFTVTDCGDRSSSGDLTVFACDNGSGYSYPGAARCYAFKIWQNDELERDFRPCVKDGEGGLYDAQNHVIYLPIGRPIVGSNLGPTLGDDPLVAESRLAYVESDGSTWVDTGIVGRSGTKAELTFMPLWRTDCDGTLQSEDMCLLGARADLYGDANRFFLCHATQGSLAYGYGGFIRASAVLATGEVHTVVADLGVGGQTVTLGGDILRQDADMRTINTTLPLYLLAANVGGEAKYPARARIYRAKIWQDGTLVRDYMPMQTTNGEVGLWDRVSRTFAPLSRPFSAVGEVTGPAQVGSVILVR